MECLTKTPFQVKELWDKNIYLRATLSFSIVICNYRSFISLFLLLIHFNQNIGCGTEVNVVISYCFPNRNPITHKMDMLMRTLKSYVRVAKPNSSFIASPNREVKDGYNRSSKKSSPAFWNSQIQVTKGSLLFFFIVLN